MKLIYISVLIFHVFDVICVSLKSVVVPQESAELTQMPSIVYRTINKYYCSARNISGEHLLMYGANAWTFPPQDVNLTLRYPRSNLDDNDELKEFLITGFKVILHMDSQGSEGFVTDGGVLKDTITLSFISSNITTMQYQFWVYGIDQFTSTIPTNIRNLC